MTSDSEDDYLYSEISASAAQAYASAPGMGTYHAGDIRKILIRELEGRMHFDSQNVLRRLGVNMVDDNLVKNCVNRMNTNPDFAKHKKTLLDLVKNADGQIEEEDELHSGKKKTNSKERGKKQELLMMDPLHSIFEMIRLSGPATYEREWIYFEDSKLKGEGDTFSFPQISPDFTVCEVSGTRSTTYKVNNGKRLWRRRLAFVELKASSKQGLVGTKQPKATEFTAQAADYARLHMSARPFQLYSVGLLIFGRKFCVAMFDRDGVEFSRVEDMWDNLPLFVRVIRRLCCDMSPEDLGMDPNVKQLPLNHPVSQACRLYSKQSIPRTHRSYNEEIAKFDEYPTYSVAFDDDTYYTVGLPVWSTLSLMGRGTNVWKVTQSPQNIGTSLFIMKSAWRQASRVQESLIYEHVKVIKRRLELQRRQHSAASSKSFGRPEGLVEYSKGADVSLRGNRKLTTANLRGLSGNQEENTTVLHRVFFKTIGRALWEFDNFLEFFLGVRAALAGHKFLADAGILHRDVSAGNILLSLNHNVRDVQRGFLTDFEFARIDDKQVENSKKIAVPPIPAPSGIMTDPTTRTHTTWASVQRGAPMTGTVQFMACELVDAMSDNLTTRHEICHDVESFVWVIYYATLRRLAYVERPLQDVVVSDATMIKDLKDNFKALFGYVDLKKIRQARISGGTPKTVFGKSLLEKLSAPLVVFYDDLYDYILTTRLARKPNDHPFGQATYEGLVDILDKAIRDLRQLNQYSQL